jgi:hypothetical protein
LKKRKYLYDCKFQGVKKLPFGRSKMTPLKGVIDFGVEITPQCRVVSSQIVEYGG